MGANTFNADTFTAGPAPALHAGTNVQISHVQMVGTASGVMTFNLTPLPAGAEVISTRVHMSNALTPGNGGEIISVYATIGGTRVQTYIASASANTAINTGNSLNSGGVISNNNGWLTKNDNRLTASANLVMVLSGTAGTGTASCDFAVVTEYLARKRGD